MVGDHERCVGEKDMFPALLSYGVPLEPPHGAACSSAPWLRRRQPAFADTISLKLLSTPTDQRLVPVSYRRGLRVIGPVAIQSNSQTHLVQCATKAQELSTTHCLTGGHLVEIYTLKNCGKET